MSQGFIQADTFLWQLFVNNNSRISLQSHVNSELYFGVGTDSGLGSESNSSSELTRIQSEIHAFMKALC